MRIARGTGLKGLCGIPPVNGNIIRPILCLTRAQIEEESRRCGIPHREDSTNHSDDYTRNLIRHRIMPVMRDINPLVNVTEMTRLLREDEELLAESARSFLEKHRSGARLFIPPLPDLPRPVASRVVREFCGAGLSARHVDAVMDLIKSPDPSARLSLPGLKLRREYSYLIKGEEDKKTFSPRVLPLDSSVIIDELGIKVTSGRGKAQGIYNSLTNFIISWDKIS